MKIFSVLLLALTAIPCFAALPEDPNAYLSEWLNKRFCAPDSNGHGMSCMQKPIFHCNKYRDDFSKYQSLFANINNYLNIGCQEDHTTILSHVRSIAANTNSILLVTCEVGYYNPSSNYGIVRCVRAPNYSETEHEQCLSKGCKFNQYQNGDSITFKCTCDNEQTSSKAGATTSNKSGANKSAVVKPQATTPSAKPAASDARRAANEEYAEKLRNPDNWQEYEAHEAELPPSTDATDAVRNADDETLTKLDAPGVAAPAAVNASDIEIKGPTNTVSKKDIEKSQKELQKELAKEEKAEKKEAEQATKAKEEYEKTKNALIHDITAYFSSSEPLSFGEHKISVKTSVVNAHRDIEDLLREWKTKCNQTKPDTATNNIVSFVAEEKTNLTGSSIDLNCKIKECSTGYTTSFDKKTCVKSAETKKQEKNQQNNDNKTKCAGKNGRWDGITCWCGAKKQSLDDGAASCPQKEENVSQQQNNCKAEGGEWKSAKGTCDCKDTRVWNKETETCELPAAATSSNNKNTESSQQNNCKAEGGEWKFGKCDCKDTRVWNKETETCELPAAATSSNNKNTESSQQNNCKAEGGEWKSAKGTCDCKDNRVWNKETETCELPAATTPSEKEQLCKNNGGIKYDAKKDVCTCPDKQVWQDNECKDATAVETDKKAEKQFLADTSKLEKAFDEVVKAKTKECTNKKGTIKDGICEVQQN